MINKGMKRPCKMYTRSALMLLVVSFWLIDCQSSYGQLNKLRQANAKAKRLENQAKRAQRDINKLFSQEKRQVTPDENVMDSIIWDMPRYIPERGMINDYAYFYKSINGEHRRLEFKNDGSLTNISYDPATDTYYNRLNKIDALNDTVEVFGWHPYWMKDKYQSYHYNLLSTISYFSYDINPVNGLANDEEAIQDWKTTPMIDSAKAHGVKVLLSVTNYGERENRLFLDDKLIWDRLIDSLKVLVTARGAQGIDLDFESIPKGYSAKFTDFVKKLSSELDNAVGRDSAMLTVQVQPYNNKDQIDFLALEDAVDYFIIQGYDYSLVDCNGKPGPVSPLLSINSDCACIVNTFDYCLRKGLPAGKMILGLPAYGTSWRLTGVGRKMQSKFEEYLTYEDILSEYANKYEPYYDPISGSTFFQIDNGDRSTQLIWYESKEGMDRKCAWALDHQLKGVAIWALGYDGGNPGIWNAVASNFGVSPIQQIEVYAADDGVVYGMVAELIKHRKAIGLSIFILLGFFILGLFVSLFDWRVREAFFGSYAYRAVFSGVLIFLFSIGILFFFPGLGAGFLLFLGMIVGGLIVYVVTNRYLAYRDKLP